MNDRLDLQTLTAAILRRWVAVLVATASFAALGYLIAKEQAPTYEATTSVLVGQDPPGSIVLQDSDRALKEQLALTFAEFAVRSAVLEPAAESLGMGDRWRSLRSRVAIELAPKTLLLDIVVTGESPEEAARAADAVAGSLVRVSAPYSPFVQHQIGPARADPEKVAPNVRMTTLFAGVLGFIVASAIALTVELSRVRRRRVFRSADDIPFLGVVQTRLRAASPIDPDGTAREEAGAIISNLRAVCRPNPVRTVCIIGKSQAARTRVSLQLAAAFAQSGLTTVVVDLGLRDPILHTICDTAMSPGAADLLESRSWQRAVTPDVRPNLRILAAGNALFNPSILLTSDAIERIAAAIEPEAEVVVFDLPLTGQLSEVGAVGEKADARVLVVGNRLTRSEERRAGQELAALGARLNGLVVVHHSFFSRLKSPPVIDDPSDVIDDPSDAIDDPVDDDPSDAIDDSVDNPSDAIDDPSDAIDDPSEVIDDSVDVTDDLVDGDPSDVIDDPVHVTARPAGGRTYGGSHDEEHDARQF